MDIYLVSGFELEFIPRLAFAVTKLTVLLFIKAGTAACMPGILGTAYLTNGRTRLTGLFSPPS
jgi:hypothetical protein